MNKNRQQKKWRGRTIRFMSAQTISLFGSSLVQYAIIWYITLTTSSGIMMTISTACGFVPQIVISLFAGVWIDRYDRKRMCMLADAVIAASTLILALLFLGGYRSVWLLFLVLLIRSAGTGIQTPAVNALIPQMVPAEHLMKINGINSTISSLMMFLSPAVSGAVLSVAAIETTFFIDVITAAIGIGIMFTISIPPLRSAQGERGFGTESVIQEMKYGFRYLKDQQSIRNLLLFQIVVLILISPSAFLTPLMVSRTFGAQVWRLTFSEMTFSAGAAAGGLLIAAWGGFSSRLHTTVLAGFLYGILMIGLGISPVYPAYLVCNFLIGVTMPCYNAPINVMIQEQADPAMHGRIFSFMQITNACALPLGMLIFGPLADVTRVQNLLIFGGIAVVCCTFYTGKKNRSLCT